jgi:hypothetical protein
MSDTSIADLEKRVQALENKLWVALAVAAIFGISGAFGFSMLRDAQKQLADLRDGVKVVEQTRDSAIRSIGQVRDSALQDLKQDEQARISDFNGQIKPIVQQAVSSEMGAQISGVKRWTAFIYSEAARVGLPGSGANGWWQKSLIDQNATVQAQVK